MIEQDVPILECPHCGDYVLIEKLNCGIFRHGTIKKTGKQVEPHADKKLCDFYINNQLIYGCGKPFQIIKNDTKFIIQICEYI